MDLVTFVRSLLANGHATGWQQFGGGSEWNGKELGSDLGLDLGTPIPGASGVVTAVDSWGYGDYAVTTRLAGGALITVGHVTPDVVVGNRTNAGQIIAHSRGLASPISSGPHIEVRVQPDGGAFVDPVGWLQSVPATGGGTSSGSARASSGSDRITLPGGYTINKPTLIGGAIVLGLALAFDII